MEYFNKANKIYIHDYRDEPNGLSGFDGNVPNIEQIKHLKLLDKLCILMGIW